MARNGAKNCGMNDLEPDDRANQVTPNACLSRKMREDHAVAASNWRTNRHFRPKSHLACEMRTVCGSDQVIKNQNDSDNQKHKKTNQP
jgi:hypothetical protein